MVKTLVTMVLLLGCAERGGGEPQESAVESAGKRRDAAIDSPPPVDAAPGGAAGYVSCLGSGPAGACVLASRYCCFDIFAPPNNGECLLNGASCLMGGDLHCDTDADCSAGNKCWAYEFNDPDLDDAGSAGNLHVTGLCRSTPPVGEPRQVAGPWHLCYPGDGTCNAGQTCVQADPTAALYAFSTKIYVCSPF